MKDFLTYISFAIVTGKKEESENKRAYSERRQSSAGLSLGKVKSTATHFWSKTLCFDVTFKSKWKNKQPRKKQ